MKSTGMVRGIDKMGRVVLPTETRKLLNLVAGKSAVEIYTDDDSIVLKKYVPACIFCDSVDDIVEYKGNKILVEDSMPRVKAGIEFSHTKDGVTI